MNKYLIAGGAAALTLVLGAGAMAQQAGQDRTRRDADGDGRISRAEFVDARLTRLRAADANGDGTVSVEELTAQRTAQRAEHANRMFARLDANSDGSITRAEFDAARTQRQAERAERREGRMDRPHRAEGRMRGGQDRRGGPGGRGGPEAGERGPIVISQVEARLGEAFTRLDKNGDGVLTAQERREHRGQRGPGRRGAGAPVEAPAPSPQTPASE